jgi:hypothetical protein
MPFTNLSDKPRVSNIGQNAPSRCRYSIRVLAPSEDRLRGLWLKAIAASDPSEKDTLLFEFRDAVHERLEQLRADKKLPIAS